MPAQCGLARILTVEERELQMRPVLIEWQAAPRGGHPYWLKVSRTVVGYTLFFIATVCSLDGMGGKRIRVAMPLEHASMHRGYA